MYIGEKMSSYRTKARPYAIFLYIWGFQWVISAGLNFFEQWRDLQAFQEGTVISAAVLSIVVALFGKRSLLRRANDSFVAVLLLCLIMLVGAVLILDYIQAIDPFFLPVLNSFVLAIGYAFLSIYLGRPLMFMSIWLFVLTGVVAVWYIGFSALLLKGFGGLSLIALAWLIGQWNRGRRRSRTRS
jgi:hypothetical protein